MQMGDAKTVKEALKMNFNRNSLKETFKGGVPLVKAAVLSSTAFYGIGFAVINQHKKDPILVQAAWGLTTVLPEQISVVEATKSFRSRKNLSSDNISRKGWARINTLFFTRHLFANPATIGAVLTLDKLFEDVVPTNYHPLSSFVAGALGPWAIHRCGYSFLVSASVQTMMDPEQTLKQAWKNAAKENFIKAGDIRAAGRAGTSAIAFGLSKLVKTYFSDDKLQPEKPRQSVNHATLFANTEVKKVEVSTVNENTTSYSRKT